jgi:anti-sigma B factor antagonist
MNEDGSAKADGERRSSWPNGDIELQSRPVQDGIVIAVRGEIDLATAGVIERELIHVEKSHDLVVLDLSETSFMDSTGIHMIVSASHRLRGHGARLVLVPGPPQIRRLLELTGVAEHVELTDDVTQLDPATASS